MSSFSASPPFLSDTRGTPLCCLLCGTDHLRNIVVSQKFVHGETEQPTGDILGHRELPDP